MSDRPGDEGQKSDGLDAWFSANFPPKNPDAVPPREEPAPPPAVPPSAPVSEEPVQPPAASPPTEPYTPPAKETPVPPAEPVWPPVSPVSSPPSSAQPAWPPAVPPAAPTEVIRSGESSGLDDLFGESAFRDYDAEPGPSENPFAAKPASGGEPQERGVSTVQKTLLWVAGSLVAVLALVALFTLGTKLPALLGPAPAVVADPSDTPSPTPTAAPLGPVAPGVYPWDELLGGECLDPYSGPWAEEYTVVDCEEPHPAQLMTRGTFVDEDNPFAAYPGLEALQSQVSLLCTAATVVDYGKAKAYTDIQFEASYAATADEWADGNHDYFCFMLRSSGGEITGSIAKPQVVPTPTPAPSP